MKSETIKKSNAPTSTSNAGDVRGWVVTALFVLAVFYTLYLTRSITLPIVVALLLHFLLRPVVRALHRAYVPVYLASAIVVIGLLATLGYAGYALSEPMAQWVQKAPDIVRQLERKLRPIQEKVQEVDKAAAQVGKIAGTAEPPGRTVQVQGTSVRAIVWSHVQPLLTGIVVMLFLLYFLLATGDRLTQRIADLATTRRGERQVIDIVDSVERTISGYLATVTLINIGLGACTALLMYILGMPNPLLWGAMAAILNFIPYLGSLVSLTVLAVVALLTFDDISRALLVPASFLILTSLEGQLLTPLVLGRRLSLNPVAIFVGLIFWGWLWGPVGALLAVPVLVTLKIIFDHVSTLHGWGELLDR